MKKKYAELKNECDGIVYYIRKKIDENGKKIGKKNVDEIENVINEFNKISEENEFNINKIKNILNKLKLSMNKIIKI
jgi:molecular chaperone DnaK (HSP70)